MTGIERLRDFARHMKDFSVWPGGQKLLNIADQIEREMCDLSSERLADSSDYADLQGEVFSVCKALGVELEEGDTGSKALTRLYKAVTYLPFVRQSMDNIEQEIKDGVNSIAECLGIRDEIQAISIAKVCPRIVDELDRRLMPEGCEWPRYEDGEPVRFEDELPEFSKTIYKTVKTVLFQNNGCIVIENNGGSANRRVILWKNERVKRPKVLAADGEPLEVGQTVWHVDMGDELYVSCFSGGMVNVSDKKGGGLQLLPSQLTHQCPFSDTWERLEEDAKSADLRWFDDDVSTASDLVRRAKALAERERDE